MEMRQQDGGMSFLVRVQPRGGSDAIEGEREGALRVRLSAPPVDDRANEALARLLAERLNRPRAAVRILSGGRSRNKRVWVAGATFQEIESLLEERC
jgi:uncharacterized protein (TIGR00251 family)